jgi:ABC-type Na+ transport system ATPase subunit NatA
LRLDGVAKRYGIRRPWVVRDVSLDIPPGGLVRFEGKNGSGKSTILRVIAGVSQPSRGSVTGRPVTGYVPERFPPALPFPAREYLSHIGRVHGLAGGDLNTRITECLDRLGGRELGSVPLRHMSKGMCQKVAVAQALLPGAGLLVLDEAWTGLDVHAKAALDDAVEQRLAGGGSVVFVDHEPARLARLDAERWRLDGSLATRVGGSGGALPGAATSGTEPGSDDGPVVVIEVTGQPPPEAGDLPGVVSVRRAGERTVVRALASSSDDVLRALLTADETVRVQRVATEPAGTEPAGTEPAGTEQAGTEPASTGDAP